jgi:hypothetical protein
MDAIVSNVPSVAVPLVDDNLIRERQMVPQHRGRRGSRRRAVLNEV